jgi:alpha-D-ribose 1-methylphosphonate 5-triphosphate synthase subunit PhnI
MKRLGAMVIAAGVVLSVSLLRPPIAVGQTSREVNGGAQALAGEPTAGSGLMNRANETDYSAMSVAERALRGQETGVRVSQDADASVRAWQGSPEEALLGRRR